MHAIFLVLILLSSNLLSGSPRGVESESDVLSALQAGDFNRAANDAVSALKNRPQDAELWNLLGIARTELGQHVAARKAFDKGLQLQPASISLNENIGLLYFRTGDYAKAKVALNHAIQLGSPKASVRYSLAACQLRTGEPLLARKQLIALETDLQGSADYWEERGRANLTYDASAAETDFLHATQLDANKLSAWNGAAKAAERQALDEKALAHLVQARSIAPEDPATLIHFATICIRRDLGPDARDALEKVLVRDPKNAQAIFLLARAHIATQDWQKALDRFTQFVVLRPGYAPAHYAMGWVNLQLNRREQARRNLTAALRLSPKYPDARYELAQMKLDDGSVVEATQSLSVLLRDEPNHVRARLALGDALLRQNKASEASVQFRRASRLDPQSSAARYKLATALSRLGERDEAAKERTIAADLVSESKKKGRTQLRLVLPEKGSQ